MAIPTPTRTGFERRQDGINNGASDVRWDSWDCEIQVTVSKYNHHLSGTAGYIPLDWQFIKAMLWVETGADHPQWNSRPMQIGVAGDPGLTSFLSGNEGGDLILPPIWKGPLTTTLVRTTPAYNICAGVGYLLMRMANFEYRSVPGADSDIYEVAVKSGDSLEKIARAQASTIDMLKKLNPAVTVLRPGQTLKYTKASVRKVIASWRHISTTSIAQRYNGGGDLNYAKKLDYALSLVREKKTAPCPQ